MTNIRIVRLVVKSSTLIEITFTNNLSPNVGINNVSIEYIGAEKTNPIILSTSVSDNIFKIYTRPLIARAYCKFSLFSTEEQRVMGSKGEYFIEDGSTNIVFFLCQEEENEIRDDIISGLPDIYSKEPGTLIYNAIDGGAREILQSKHSVGEAKSANYLSVEVIDEIKIRGKGATDRFDNEGVFEILRAGTSPTGVNSQEQIVYESFPSDPVSLRQIFISEEKVSNEESFNNRFDGLTITLSKEPVIKVSSIVLTRPGATPSQNVSYTYNISKYKYGLLESKYDNDNSYSFFDILDNQIKLTVSAIGPDFPMPQSNDYFTISYYYNRKGRNIDVENVEVYTHIRAIREQVPAVATSFFLGHAPIIDSNGNTATMSGVSWLDPAKNYDPLQKHSSFVTELRYNPANLPRESGQFAVNYETGQVFVFGSDGSGFDGTTVIPPVATYNYKKIYNEGLDYILYSELCELASIPSRELRGNPATVSFWYEDNFSEGEDFEFSSHIEVINERVENRLIDNIGLITKKNPVNQVFRIFNETTGELYEPTRISKNKVYFSAINPPRIENIVREPAQFDSSTQSELTIVDKIDIGKSFYVFKINLEKNNIMAAEGGFLGTSFNTSVDFSDKTIFEREIYYDRSLPLGNSFDKLEQTGDYLIDYSLGVVYLARDYFASSIIGDVSYKYGKVRVRNNHIVRVDNIYKSSSVLLENSQTFIVGEIEDNLVSISGLQFAGEEKDVEGDPIVVGSDLSLSVQRDIFKLRNVFQVSDLKTTFSAINFGEEAIVSKSSPDTVVLSSKGVVIEEDTVILNDGRNYVKANRIQDLFDEGLVSLISAISVEDLVSGDNYYIQGTDGYVDALTNSIYLPTGAGSEGLLVKIRYRAQLRPGAAVLVEYSIGNTYIDYSYCYDELIVSYEYGDNVLDWSVSNQLVEGNTYYVSYKYGAMRDGLRDNFGVLSGIEELLNISDDLSRETYRDALIGSLQTFPKGPTTPSIKELVKAITKINPNITESVFLEWVLGRDYLNLQNLKLQANSIEDMPDYLPGKFGKGIHIGLPGQTATLPVSSNLSVAEGTWETFVVPDWDGIANDADLTFDLFFDGHKKTEKVFIGSYNNHPEAIPFTLNKEDPAVLGTPSKLHTETGYFIWYDLSAKLWRVRVRAPIDEKRNFTGNVFSSGEFYKVRVARTASGDENYEDSSQQINEPNDLIRSTKDKIYFSFVVDDNDYFNTAYDSYDSYYGSFAGFDGIDFISDEIHYLFDTSVTDKCQMSLFKDGKGYLKYKVVDQNGSVKMISANIQDWLTSEIHHIAISWKINTIEQKDELHLFLDGFEVPNIYRFGGYLSPQEGTLFMEEAHEVLQENVLAPVVGGFDLNTVSGSNIVTSDINFEDIGVTTGSRFIILDNTEDGTNTLTYPYVFVRNVESYTLELEKGDSSDYNCVNTLSDVRFSINPLILRTSTSPQEEKIKVFSVDSYGEEKELNSPLSLYPDYEFSQDGYLDYVNIYNGVEEDNTIILKTYGLNISRHKQYAYVWSNGSTNIINTKMPVPISISKINITKIIVKSTVVGTGLFSIIATDVGGHFLPVLNASLDFCQPSNTDTGRKLTVVLRGDNVNFGGLNKVSFVGETYDGSGFEELEFTKAGTLTTTKFFTRLDDVVAYFSPIELDKSVGIIEVREAAPINHQENDGDYAQVFLSVQQAVGSDGQAFVETFDEGQKNVLIDSYGRFDKDDIGKTIHISSPIDIVGIYTIEDVALDPSETVKDSNTVILSGSLWGGTYNGVNWRLINTSFGDSGFANGLITLEVAGSGGVPFLLGQCWYEIDFPTYLRVPWDTTPETLFLGSNNDGEKQAGVVFDELRILSELSTDTGIGEALPSSGRSITTDALAVREYDPSPQTLVLFHFDEETINYAPFYNNYAKSFRQCSNSVNGNFGQSAVFNSGKAYRVDNKSIFNNNKGTIEFWISPILDTYNDPTERYYVDLTPAETAVGSVITNKKVSLSVRARQIMSVTVNGNSENYFTGGSLNQTGTIISLGKELPFGVSEVEVIYVPITSRGDRFSIFKDDNNQLVLYVSASGVEYQISSPIYWKKNSWHRVLVEWSLNNVDNQDRLILMVDGTEAGIIRYGTGLLYGSGFEYGQQNIWGSADIGTVSSRNILADINLLDIFNTIYIGSDYTEKFSAMARLDNIRFSSEARAIVYLGGQGPGQLIGKDLLFSSNINVVYPVIEDAITRLLLDFDTEVKEVDYLAITRNKERGIFDFYVEVIDTFNLASDELVKELIVNLINRLKPAHTRAFVSFIK